MFLIAAGLIPDGCFPIATTRTYKKRNALVNQYEGTKSLIVLPDTLYTLKSSRGLNDTWAVSQVWPWYPWRLHKETFDDVSSTKLSDDPE